MSGRTLKEEEGDLINVLYRKIVHYVMGYLKQAEKDFGKE